MILTRNFISLQVSILNPPGFRKMGIIRQPFKLEKNQGHRWNRDKILQNRGLSGDFFSPFQLLDEWRKISVDEIRQICASAPKRLEAIAEAEGSNCE